MTTLKDLLQKIHQNLQTLQERAAGYGGNAPLELLNQITDHRTAIALINEALTTDLTETGLTDLKAALRPLLIAANVEQINLETVKLDQPFLPFEPETVLIPAGPFWLGCQPGPETPPEETPQHQVVLPAFQMGRYPVTNAQYAAFIQNQPHQDTPKKNGWFLRQPPPGKLDHPVAGVSWTDAVAYCRWLSKQTGRTYRLPTEAEWEKAAIWRGDSRQIYPWGNSFDPARCNTLASNRNDTSPVGYYSPLGDSPAGCADMAGNVQEWVSTLWGSHLNQSAYPYPYQPHDGREAIPAPAHLPQTYRLHRGGSFRDGPERVRGSSRGWSDPDSKIRWRGFRVVLEL